LPLEEGAGAGADEGAGTQVLDVDVMHEPELEDEEEAGAATGAGAGTIFGLLPLFDSALTETTVPAVLELLDPDVEKMMSWAVSPSGTVTVQNSAPPAPTVPPVHLFGPMVEGLHSHGIPLQFPLGQSILMAKPGSELGHVFVWQQ